MVYRELGWLCPRDGTRLQVEQVGQTRFMSCKACRGVMVELDDLRLLVEDMGGLMPTAEMSTRSRPLRCPACGDALSGMRTGGVDVDSCPRHGVWFDRRELAGLLESVGLEALRRRRQ